MFEKRAQGSEFLDDYNADESFALQSYRFMAFVNEYFGGRRVMLDFIKGEINSRPAGAGPLRILDIGSGACDIPAAICRWAESAGRKIEFTCIEPSQHAILAAKSNIAPYPNIKLIQADVFNYTPSEPFDCAAGSLFFHHLSDQQIIELIRRLRDFGCRSILINDLHRSFSCYFGALLTTAVLPSRLRHDALLSVRRSFKPAELDQFLCHSFPNAQITVRTIFFGRIGAKLLLEMAEM